MSELSPIQQRAIAALLIFPTNAQAAQHAGISERQLYRWLQDETFRAHLERAEAQVIQDATRRFSSLLDSATDQLEVLLMKPDLSPGDKVRVIRTVLEFYPRLREMTSFEQRLAELEKAVEDEA